MIKKSIQSVATKVSGNVDDLPFAKCSKCGRMVSITEVEHHVGSDGENLYLCKNCLNNQHGSIL